MNLARVFETRGFPGLSWLWEYVLYSSYSVTGQQSVQRMTDETERCLLAAEKKIEIWKANFLFANFSRTIEILRN